MHQEVCADPAELDSRPELVLDWKENIFINSRCVFLCLLAGTSSLVLALRLISRELQMIRVRYMQIYIYLNSHARVWKERAFSLYSRFDLQPNFYE